MKMTVYIEAVIIDNFFVTYLTAVLSYRILAVSISKKRALFTSVLGTAAAVFYPFIHIHNALLILIKILLCAVLSFILFYKKCNIFKGGGIFLLVTFLFGGMLFCLGLMIYSDVDKALRLPLTKIPIGILIAAALILYVIIRRFSGIYKRIKDAKNFIYPLEIDVFFKTVKGRGFVDTGNRLYDYKTGLAVIILSAKLVFEILDEKKLLAFMEQKCEKISDDAHYIDYATVSNQNNKILVLKPDEIRLYSGKDEHRIKDVMIGFSLSKFTDSVEYDVILNPSILANI